MPSKRQDLSIGEVAAIVGVRSSALRYYERVGLLQPRRCSGQRRYGIDVVDRLHLIGFAKRAGFRLVEIKKLFGEGRRVGKKSSMAEGWRSVVPGKIAEVEREMVRLQEARERLQTLLACQCRQPEQCGRRLQGGENGSRRRHVTRRGPSGGGISKGAKA